MLWNIPTKELFKTPYIYVLKNLEKGFISHNLIYATYSRSALTA